MKKKRGAPKKENPASSRLEIRCTPGQKERWTVAAKKSGLSLSSWVKKLADDNS